MSAKYLHFEKAFLPCERKPLQENPFPQILRDATVTLRVRKIGPLDAGVQVQPLRTVARRKKTER